VTVSQQTQDPAPARSPQGVVVGLVRAARPKQWLKNVLVLAAPAAAGVLFDADVIVRTLVAFACFCLVASGTYLLNDAMDVEADRMHPRKRHRPIAAGIVPVGVAKIAAVVVLLGGLALGAVAADWRLSVVLLVYVVVMQAYTLGLKRVAVI
jgi:decaprenyl-phosphate phosphoribosyltransferase